MLATFVLASSLANIAAADVPKAGFERPALVQVAQGGFGQGTISSGGGEKKKGRRRLFGAELERLPVNKTNKAGSAKGSNPTRVKQIPAIDNPQRVKPGKQNDNAGNNAGNHLVPGGTGSFTSPGVRAPNKGGNNAINDKAQQEINQLPSKQ